MWDLLFLNPMLNLLIILAHFFAGSFGVAIIILTMVVRAVLLPLTLRQLRVTKKIQELQPKLQEIQKKYAKDKERLSRETMKLYREHRINPLGCAFPMLLQFPVWIALYQSVLKALSTTPERLLDLSQHLYGWHYIQEAIPLGSKFLWFDLSRPDFMLALLVMLSMWVLQRMSTVPTTDPRQQSMNRMMEWMMPLMFGFFALTFPSGLALYWLISNLISIGLQYKFTGWGTLRFPVPQRRTR